MNDFKDKLNEIEQGLKIFLENEKLFGNDSFISKYKNLKVKEKPITTKTSKNKMLEMQKISQEINNCKKCELYARRKNTVAGEGNFDADLVFIGEGPGKDEDEQGRPFVGRAGKLLTKIINAMGLKRQEVFIGNIVKCRPPNNRAPYPYEIKACNFYLKKQLQIINPKVICTLGKFSSQTILDTDVSISRLRGKFYEYRGIKVMPTYHPAYLLRNSSGKKDVWEDMQNIMKELKKSK